MGRFGSSKRSVLTQKLLPHDSREVRHQSRILCLVQKNLIGIASAPKVLVKDIPKSKKLKWKPCMQAP